MDAPNAVVNPFWILSWTGMKTTYCDGQEKGGSPNSGRLSRSRRIFVTLTLLGHAVVALWNLPIGNMQIELATIYRCCSAET
jgi:hypothetical protein